MNLPVILDFEIWKASNMLFQPIPYGGVGTVNKEIRNRNWDDNWHETHTGDTQLKTSKMQKNIETQHTETTPIHNDNEIPHTEGIFRDLQAICFSQNEKV